MSDKAEVNEKQPYEKPRLRPIELVAEEMLAVSCKKIRGGPGGIAGARCGITPCKGTGS
jgi:hypothetical protein